MNNTVNRRVLVLGATGKTGSRVAGLLSEQGVSVRTAARGGADIRFDWNNPATFEGALQGVTGVYLVSPVMRVDFAGVVSDFLDQAEQAGVRNVTYLSAYGMEHAPAEVALRAVELDLESRGSFTYSIIRPAWFMQNFSETFLKPVDDEIVVSFRPEPGVAPDHRMNGKLDGSGESEPPWRDRNGPGKHSPRRTGPDQMLLKDVHSMSVLHKEMSVKLIESLTSLP